MSTPYDPSTRSSTHRVMLTRTKRLRAVWGGTETLVAEGEVYLPKFEKEDDKRYQQRKGSARLRRNMFRQAVERITGRIFEVPVRLKDATTNGKVLADDADRRGNSLDRVARNLYRDALYLGFRHILVDYPVVEAENLAQERAAGARPYLIELQPEQVLRCYQDDDGHITHLAWECSSTQWDEVTGQEVTMLEIHERFSVPGEKTSRGRTWQQTSTPTSAILPAQARPVLVGGAALPQAYSLGWQLEKDFVISQNRIMLHTLYAERETHMLGRTPLTEVADLTIEHFQIASDYRNCLRHVLFPILTATGVEQKDVGAIVLGPDTILGSSKSDAKFAYLEHTGKAIEAGYKDLESLEQRAEAYAGRLTKSSGDVKATTEAINSAEVSSFAKDMAQSLQDVLQAILDDCALWTKEESLSRADVNMDFAVDLPQGDLEMLKTMRQNNDITRETLWNEATRRNVLSRDFDPDEEKRMLEEQERESMDREQEAMRFAAGLKEDTGSGAPFPAKEPGA